MKEKKIKNVMLNGKTEIPKCNRSDCCVSFLHHGLFILNVTFYNTICTKEMHKYFYLFILVLITEQSDDTPSWIKRVKKRGYEEEKHIKFYHEIAHR